MAIAAHTSVDVSGGVLEQGNEENGRHFGASTDDAAIFIEDTIDRSTVRCISSSPSAIAILTPQRLTCQPHVDTTEYDASHIGSLSAKKKSRNSCPLTDLTNARGAQLSFSKSPTPKVQRGLSVRAGSSLNSHHSSLSRQTPYRDRQTPSPVPPDDIEPVVPLADYQRLERERNRFQKMFEHQKALYEEMADKQADTYAALQDKIVEVVALSSRNEESKRFIRQLKREMAESKTRVMDIQNRALEDARYERHNRDYYEKLIEEQERKYARMVERDESKMAGMESLLKDLTYMQNEKDHIQVSHLDSLLKAAYSKSTALFSDILRQGRQIDLLNESKAELVKQLEVARREKRDMECNLADERRRMMMETERFIEQIEEQQQSILSLRQMLIRTMDNCDSGDRSSYNSAMEDTDSSSYHISSDEDDDDGGAANEQEPHPPGDASARTACTSPSRDEQDPSSTSMGGNYVHSRQPLKERDHTSSPLHERGTNVERLGPPSRSERGGDAGLPISAQNCRNSVNKSSGHHGVNTPAEVLASNAPRPREVKSAIAPTSVKPALQEGRNSVAMERMPRKCSSTGPEASMGGIPRKRLDFSTALAVVTEKRERDRRALAAAAEEPCRRQASSPISTSSPPAIAGSAKEGTENGASPPARTFSKPQIIPLPEVAQAVGRSRFLKGEIIRAATKLPASAIATRSSSTGGNNDIP